MIEASQMQDSVQHQDFYFFGHGMSQTLGVFPGNIHGDCHVSGHAV